MPLNGSGTFVPAGSSVYPAVTTTTISSTDFNALLADVVTALSTAIYKDGQSTPTANIKMGGFKLTGLAAGSAATDSASIGGVETLTNKTLTSPTLNSLTLTNPANTVQALVDGATISWDMSLGAIATVTLGGSRTLAAPTNIKAGGHYVLHVTQDGTGGRALTWNAVFKGHGGQAMASVQPVPTLSTTSSFLFESPDGTNLNLIWSRIGNVQIFSATGTYTPTAGMRFCKATVVGGGGGSGGCAATAGGQAAGAGGGASGSASIKTFSASTIGATQTATVGTGGLAGTAGNNGGGTGVTSTFGALLTAPGGGGGSGSSNITNTNVANGGTPGTGTLGDLNVRGDPGGWGLAMANSTIGIGGKGGSSIFGGGGVSVSTGGSTSGTAGGAFGGGASGSANGQSQSAVAGSAGGDGVIVVEEFF